MARALAYRAGIVKIDLEALTLVAKEVIHHLGVLAYKAAAGSKCEHKNLADYCKYEEETIFYPEEDWRLKTIDHLQEGGTTRYTGDYFAKHCPPPETDSDGCIEEYIIIPRHIKDVAIRMGLNPVLLCNKFGTQWAPRNGSSAKDEVREEKARYAGENIIYSKDDSEEESGDESDDGGHYDDGTSISYCSSISYDSDESRVDSSSGESDSEESDDDSDEDEEQGDN